MKRECESPQQAAAAMSAVHHEVMMRHDGLQEIFLQPVLIFSSASRDKNMLRPIMKYAYMTNA